MDGNQNPGFTMENDRVRNGSVYSSKNDINERGSTELDAIPKVIVNGRYDDESWSSDSKTKKPNRFQKFYDAHFQSVEKLCKKYYHQAAKVGIYLIILAYGIGASIYWSSKEGDYIDWCSGIGLLWLMLAAVLLDLLITIGKHFHAFDWIKPVLTKPLRAAWERAWRIKVFQWVVYLIPLAAVIIYLAIDARNDRLRLISFLGLVVLMLFGFLFSRHPDKINWRPVVWGITLQYTFGLLTIRWDVGRNILQCIGDKVTTFLAYTNNGSIMVYGEFLIKTKAVFAFQVLSTIFFFSFFIQILYYYGVMQWVINRLGNILQKTMGTTACESINTAASIFVGMTESPLLIKPYIGILTRSEIHAVMVGGLSTIAGSVMAAYISFGVSPAHLITASIMSAPAALCYSKLFYPETEKTKTGANDITMGRGEETNVLDAAASGAMSAIGLVQGIIANLIAFVSFVAFLNGIISWFGGLVGASELSFEWILSKVFIPLAWLLGVAPEECDLVATLMGLKTIVNEFVAYEKLALYIKEGRISKRAETIATYALCGFSNPGSVGILIGGLSSMAPDRRPVITEVAFRSFIAGSATCFLTACVAGTLIDDNMLGYMHHDNATTTFPSYSTVTP